VTMFPPLGLTFKSQEDSHWSRETNKRKHDKDK
jgi:hypothetical protein